MKNNLENQDIKTDKPVPMSYEALKAERDASLNAERVWETSMMAVCGEDGPASVSAFIKALAVENAALKAAFNKPDAWLSWHSIPPSYQEPDRGGEYLAVHERAGDKSDDGSDSWAVYRKPDIETPTTSAALAAIEARGVEKAAVKMQESGAQTFGDCYIALVQYAIELREVKDGQ